jgi:hypothetical protein
MGVYRAVQVNIGQDVEGGDDDLYAPADLEPTERAAGIHSGETGSLASRHINYCRIMNPDSDYMKLQ